MGQPLRVMLISGSVRKPSYTRILTEAVEAALNGLNCETNHWNPRTNPLPIADPEYHRSPGQHPDRQVRDLVDTADDSDAFVLASPIYHNSYSGALKNVLDHLTIAQFSYKPVALISHGGHRSTQAVDHLRIVTRGLLGVATPTHICTEVGDYRETEDGTTEIVAEISERIQRLANELLTFAAALRVLRR